MMERTTRAGVRLSESELIIIEKLKEAIGMTTASDVIRLAVIEAAESRGLIPSRPKVRRIHRDVQTDKRAA